MEVYGTVDSVFIARDNKGISKGFGFANFPSYEEASLAVKDLNGKKIDGEMLYVSRAMKKIEREKFLKDRYEKIKSDRQKKFGGVNLYVKYLDDAIDDSRLKDEFKKFGNITSAKVMLDIQGQTQSKLPTPHTWTRLLTLRCTTPGLVPRSLEPRSLEPQSLVPPLLEPRSLEPLYRWRSTECPAHP